MAASGQTFELSDLYIGPDAPRAKYQPRTRSESSIHWGQRKLHISEVELFTLHWDPNEVPNPICVYAGAAHGTHIPLLSAMFPAFTFHLYDPARFDITPDDKIFIYHEYFTDEVARQWAGRDDVFFISDIRTVGYQEINAKVAANRIKSKKVIEQAHIEIEQQIWEQDMAWQQTWVEIINPVHALLKFRLPHPIRGDRIVQYLQGIVYWQVWPKHSSTECRLKPTRNYQGQYQRIDWSIQEYEEWCFYHNTVVREKIKFKNPFTNDLTPVSPPELLNDFDSVAEAYILKLYCEKSGWTDINDIYAAAIQFSEAITQVITHNNPGKSLSSMRSSTFKTSSRLVHPIGPQFENTEATNYFRDLMFQFEQSDRSIDIAPPKMREGLKCRYDRELIRNPNRAWPALVKEIRTEFINTASKYSDPISIDAIQNAYNELYPPEPVKRVHGSELKYDVAPPITGPIQRTFMISGQCGLDHGPLRAYFFNLGFEEIVLEDQGYVNVGVFFLEQAYHYNPKERLRYDPRASNVTCAIKNILSKDKECITNKSNLYNNIMELDPERGNKYMARTRNLKNVRTVRKNEILILKPVGPSAGCGFGIEVVRSTAELKQSAARIFKNYPAGIASEYIINPLLLDGRKTHFRMFFLVRSPIVCSYCNSEDPNCPVCYGRPSQPASFDLYDNGRIITAQNKYDTLDFTDVTKHDTHIKSTSENYYFPQDLDKCHDINGIPIDDVDSVSAELLNQMRDILSVVAGVMIEKMKTWHYPESNFAFEVFGCDFMLRASENNYEVVLLEINDRISGSPCTGGENLDSWPAEEGPGIYSWDLSTYSTSKHYESLKSYSTFSGLFWNWVAEIGILPFYNQFEPPE